MAYVVREANVMKDCEIMLNLLKNNRSRENFSYEKRFKWIYQDNPDGKAIPWIIWEEESKIPVGFTAVFPRRILVNGREEICWNCGDFSIEPKYRSLGVALQLRKEAKKEVNNGRVLFLYAHPNDRMKIIHQRAGHQQLGCMRRYALPLRMDSYFERKFNSKLLGKVIAFPFNQILNLRIALDRRTTHLHVVQLDKPEFNNQHEELFLELAKKYSIIGVRDKTYLNWKYLENPNHCYSLINFFSGKQLIGYIIFSKSDLVIEMVECIVFPEELAKDVLIYFLKTIKSTFPEADSVSVVTFETNPIVKTLKQLRFQYRDDATSSVITYTSDGSELSRKIYDKSSWFLSVGDRDA
jgi:hypothetical protein